MSLTTTDIIVRKTPNSRIAQLDPNNLQFGMLYSDHMFQCHYEDGQWQQPEIVPYGNLSLSPATTFMHYGQAIFEGIKAYKDAEGKPYIFRPHDNWKRFNLSAGRMAMPAIPEEMFMEGLRQLIELDSAWVPSGDGTSLYIRPFMIATDEFIGVRPATKFTFLIITSPSGPYYSKPVSIYVQDKYVRAFPGGTGYIKSAGNYGVCMLPTQETREMGYDQILWTDGFEHRYVQEIGTMNVFFIIGDKAVTPNLDGTILAGVTRDSIITLLKEHGVEVEERPISIDELIEAHKNGQLREAFGAGTAASIAPIAELTIHGEHIKMPDIDGWEIATHLKKQMADIRYSRIPDVHGWMMPVIA